MPLPGFRRQGKSFISRSVTDAQDDTVSYKLDSNILPPHRFATADLRSSISNSSPRTGVAWASACVGPWLDATICAQARRTLATLRSLPGHSVALVSP